MRKVVGRKVVVNTETGSSIRGVLVKADRRLLELAEAEFLGEDQPIEMQGRVVVERRKVDYTQVL